MKQFSVFLLLVLILSAWRPGNNPATAPDRGASQAEFQWIFETTNEPLVITTVPDIARQVQALIPLQGGSLTVSGADGTRYTLEIPPDALTTETLISMTPLASLEGIPFGSSEVMAVQLEPEGAFFNNFLTLTITPPQEIPLDQQILYGFQGSQNELTLAAPVINSAEIKILIQHFSGYGVTKGLLADIEPYRQRLGGAAESRLQSEAAYQLGRVRQQQLLGTGDTGDDLKTIFEDLFARFDREVVQPRLAAAGESCAAGRLALQTLLSVERQKQLLGMSSDEDVSNMQNLFETVGMTCLKEEYELCAEDHIIHRMIPVWLGIERQSQLLGAPEGGTPLTQEARRLTEQCLRFDLEFYSSGSFDDGGDGYDSVVRSKIPIRFNTGDMKFTGKAPLVNESFEFRVKGCCVNNQRGGSTFELIDFAYISDTHSPNDQLGYVRDLNMTYFPERTTESFTITCPGPPDVTYTFPPSPLWWGIYLVTHFEELGDMDSGISVPPAELLEQLTFGGGMNLPVNAGGGYTATDWEILGGEYFAKKEWIKELSGEGVVETGTFKLYHRPGE
jgi:hypothetical protein